MQGLSNDVPWVPIRLIQDAVVVCFWLTHPQASTHCPVRLTRAEFEQLSVDLGHFETFGAFLLRRRSLQDAWDRL